MTTQDASHTTLPATPPTTSHTTSPITHQDSSRMSSSDVIHFVTASCILGEVLVAHSGQGICAVLLGDDAEELYDALRDRFPAVSLMEGDNELRALATKVVAIVQSPSTPFAGPLDMRGTVFQRTVWNALRTIPAGSTETYGALAARVGRPAAVRAVASACASNPIAVIVPCHRVVRGSGELAGYRWGLERKRTLLHLERTE